MTRPSGFWRGRGSVGAAGNMTSAREASMRVVVDFDKCKSNALCMAAAPEVFEVRDGPTQAISLAD
jgi:hypothetical protein